MHLVLPAQAGPGKCDQPATRQPGNAQSHDVPSRERSGGVASKTDKRSATGMSAADKGVREVEEARFRLESFSSADLPGGRHVVGESPEGTKILAYVEDGRISRYEAEDSGGNPRSVFLMQQSAPAVSVSLDLPLSDIVDWVCVLDDVMPYCVHDSAGPAFFPPS